LALGGKFGVETGSVYGFKAGAVFYTTNKIGTDSSNKAENDMTLFAKGSDGFPENYSQLGQAYLSYAIGNTNVKLGRQQLDTPLAGSDDARMVPNLFNALVVANTDIKDTTLILAHVSDIAYGSFANAYAGSAGAALALTGGYGGGATNYNSGKFQDMGVAAIGKPTDGVTAVAAIYKGVPGLTLQLWDYYAHDILNAIYAQADYSWKCIIDPSTTMTASAQYIGESEVGDKLAGKVDSSYWGAKLEAKRGDLNLMFAYSTTGDTTGTTLNGSIISPWGGMPAFTQGMVTRHQFLASTDAYKLQASYNLKSTVGQDITAAAYYASYDVGTKSPYATNETTTEPGFDIIYNNAGIKNLQLRFRGNFPDKFNATTSWSEYRLIANYNF